MNAAVAVCAASKSSPSVKITANGGAMKKKTRCTILKSGSELVAYQIATPTAAARMAAPEICPKRTCSCSEASGRKNFL